MKYRVQNVVNNEYLDDDSIFLFPNGEVGGLICDGSYIPYRKFGHQEYFKVINEDCERLQKQLEIAVKCLKQYANRDNWYNTYKPNSLDECPIAYKERWKKEYGYKQAEKTLEKIEEFKK